MPQSAGNVVGVLPVCSLNDRRDECRAMVCFFIFATSWVESVWEGTEELQAQILLLKSAA